ncbi:LysM peptidoglycan-binding domain-containing protein [Vreelandella utahensis]|uniref:LysM peptidoglycan-binding domain-containing protein n=1 Tax=Vreelandella halophila TaxID=86177 RepID=UPI000985D22B|nr:LysM peptidoglycan-binding domain-containing protein [Halomonas utahensis]
MRILSILLTVALGLGAAGVMAQTQLRDDHPEQYTVQPGDTLWDISARFLKEPWNWPEIWQANPQVDNPHLIYPGDVLELTWVDGQPRLTRATDTDQDREIKLSPEAKETPLDTPIPTIPLEEIRSFLSKTRIVDESTLEQAPYIVQGRDRRSISGAGDRVYARGEAQPRETLAVFRRGARHVDPETGEFLGLEARSMGRGRVAEVNGELLSVDLTASREEIEAEDRLLPTEAREITTRFQPRAPEADIQGRMIDVEDGVSNIGQYNVVTINRGEREGLETGHVLAVYKKGNQARDPVTDELLQLPSERAGLLMVFRTYEKLSYGLVLQATRPLEIMDEVRNP